MNERTAWTLPTVDIELQGDMLIITAHRSGVQVVCTIDALDLWCVDQLRNQLLPEVIE